MLQSWAATRLNSQADVGKLDVSQLSNTSRFIGDSQTLECPCLACKHEFLKQCIGQDCQCCALEDGYFLLTGDEVRDM